MTIDILINDLFGKYLRREINAEELEILIASLHDISEKDAANLSPALHELWTKAKAGELNSTAHKVDWEQVYNTVKNSDPEPITGRFFWLKRITAAAAILVLLFGAYWFFFNKQSPVKEAEPVLATRPDQIEAPMASRAAITLANGQKIYLDSAGNGMLAKQGNSELVKLSDGKIAYSGAGGEGLYNTLTNPNGSRIVNLALADGSMVWLNAGSSIKYPVLFTGNERKVEVTGEAYFEVSKDANKKFIVEANQVRTEVLGTHFNVNSYTDEEAMKITLLEGSVKVSSGQRSVILQPGEQAEIKIDHLSAASANTGLATAWLNGFFQFDKADVPAILRQVARWYDLEIVYEGKVPQRSFSGKIQRGLPLSAVLRLFEQASIPFRIEGRKLIVNG